MTNTLLAIYPDVFVGGSAMPGFPAGGWPAGDTSCTKCSSNPPSTDGKYWGDIARKAFAFSGTYPCSQQWVGGGDEYNFNGWLPAVAAQFQNLGGLSAGTAGTGAPSGWTRTVYKDTAGNVRLETNLGPSSQKHDLETVSPTLYSKVVTFLGLDKPTGACGLTTNTGTGGSGGSGTAGASGGSSVAGHGNSAGAGNSTGAAGSSNGGAPSGGAGAPSGSAGAPSTGGAAASSAGSPGTGAGGAPSGAAGSSTGNTSGGSKATAGAPGSSTAGASSGGSTSDSGGCTIAGAGHSAQWPIAGMLAAVLGALFVRRRRAQS